MFPGHTSPKAKLCFSVNAGVVNLHRITELRKKGTKLKFVTEFKQILEKIFII